MRSGVFVAAGREALVVLLPHASDAHPAHVLIGTHICLRELAVLPEYDVETHPENAQADDEYGDEKGFHGLENELGADRLVMVDLADDGGKNLSHGNNLDLVGVGCRAERNRVCHIYFFQAGIVDSVICRS